MINELLLILKDAVNAHLSASSGWGDEHTDQGQVVFPESERVDAIDLKLGAVTLLLVNLEQEHSVRPGDPYRVSLPDGSTQRVSPPIFLNLILMFVARFKDYQQGLRHTSSILQFFHSHRVLDHQNTPALSDRIEKVIMEFVTLPMSEQHNLWGLLRTAYHPSLIYRARLMILQDEDGVTLPGLSGAPERRIKQ
jgi:hypothetical protein